MLVHGNRCGRHRIHGRQADACGHRSDSSLLLDGYQNLSLEKAYRNLYDTVRLKDETEIDFSMKTKKVKDSNGFKSWSVSWFYLVLAVTVVLLAVYRMW